MDYYDYIDRLNKILLPTSQRYDAIYNKLNLGSSGGHGYAETSPTISVDDQLIASSMSNANKIRLKETFERISWVIYGLESKIASEKQNLNAITIIQNILNPTLKEALDKRIKDLSFYLEWLNRLNSRYNEERTFWDNLLKEVEITL